MRALILAVLLVGSLCVYEVWAHPSSKAPSSGNEGGGEGGLAHVLYQEAVMDTTMGNIYWSVAGYMPMVGTNYPQAVADSQPLLLGDFCSAGTGTNGCNRPAGSGEATGFQLPRWSIAADPTSGKIYTCSAGFGGTCPYDSEFTLVGERLGLQKVGHLIISDPDPAAANYVLRMPPWAGEVAKVTCEAYGGTNVVIDVCVGEDYADDTCATSLLGSTLTCDLTNGAEDSSLTSASFSARGKFSVVLVSESGSVDRLEVYMEGTRD